METTMSDDTGVVLRSTEAQLCVADFGVARDFYSGKLGFEVAFVAGDPPSYGQFARDRARLNVRVVDESVYVGDIRERLQLLSASVTVATTAEIERLFTRYRAAGVTFHQDLRVEPWGAATFVVRDPDANLILFAGPAA